ncbi:regulatory factor X-associated protein [Triplophysa rosa]|uniref:Regulatory factor X-associated protein n=1 Tax=Triplophysa rosa TaxID=992332 RepID=A0A9W7WAJ9_TRIRA|nr:regulatory factor X-associated protein [Triplophysa rosa]KAI7793742.1 putative regulatory factor X-associated protein [Triplophysa rosa]
MSDSVYSAGKDGQTPAPAESSTPSDPENLMYDADDPGDESDALDARDGAGSPEELNDDETSGESESVPKTCTYDGCTETTTQVAKARKPWMCKKHRNKMYKDKYKKKKSDQAMSSGKLEEGSEERPVSVTKQRLGSIGDRPARPSLIEQVLNQKRLSLLRSPEVISFLQQQQRLLTTQNRTQTQHNY